MNHNALSYCTHIELVTMADCSDKYQLYMLISEKCNVPDYSLLIAHVSCSLISTSSMHVEDDNINAFPRTRYNKNNIPDNFKSSQLWKKCRYRIIQYFETIVENQDDLDKGYE